MKSRVQGLIAQFVKAPRKLFLLDALGALVSAFLLFVVLRTWHEYIGLSQSRLTILSSIALVFFIYSSCCNVFVGHSWKRFLSVIAVANLGYCCVTIGIISNDFDRITALGMVYFVGEILVIFGVVILEYKTLKGGEE